MRAVRRLGFRCAAASDDPLLRRVSRIDRGCAAALPESFSVPIVGSCRPCWPRRLCRGPGRMLGRHRERAMRCRAEFANNPRAPHPNEPVAGTELLCIVRHFRVRVHPAPETDGARDGTPVQLQAVPAAGRPLPVLRPRACVLLPGLQRAVPEREAARGAQALPAHGERPRDGPSSRRSARSRR